MSGPRYLHSVDGQEVQESDVNLIAAEAARAEDWVLAELLRLPALNGTTVSKAIIPSGTYGSRTQLMAANGASGSVLLSPFRAVVGSRTALGAVTTDPTGDPTTMLAWRDGRSSVYAISDNGTTFGHAVPFTANASGNPRWDLVYVALTVDANAAADTRFVKGPSATTGTATSIVDRIVQSTSINVLAGTPGATPALPTLPADNLAGGVFNIAIGFVWIPTGFGGASTVLPNNIAITAPMVPLASQTGVVSCGPASATTPNGGDPAVMTTTWGTAGARPDWMVASDMVGGVERFVMIDANASTPSIVDTGLVDQSIDWRKRMFVTHIQVGTAVFASNSAGTHPVTPGNQVSQQVTTNTYLAYGANNVISFGQSFVVDDNDIFGITTRNGMFVASITNNWPAGKYNCTAIAGGTALGLYVDNTTGRLLCYVKNPVAIAARVFFWIKATAQMDGI